MATSQGRLLRLQSWIDDQFAGNVSGFCRYYQLPKSMASFIYQLTGGNRTFGERAARKLERDTGRPDGWLDLPVEQDTSDPIQYDKALCRMLPAPERRLIEDFIGLILFRNSLRERTSKSGVSLHFADGAQATANKRTKPPVKATTRPGQGLYIHDPATKPRKRNSR